MSKNPTLTGMMGVGQSTIGKNLAKKLNYNFVDIDKLIEMKEGLSINLIFKNKSEKYFRKLENEITIKQLNKSKSVISLGGGAFMNKNIRDTAKINSISFWLDVHEDELIKRLKKTKKRPLLYKKNLSDTIKKIYFERKKTYNKANFRVKCTYLSTEEIVEKISKLYENTRDKS